MRFDLKCPHCLNLIGDMEEDDIDEEWDSNKTIQCGKCGENSTIQELV